MRSRRIDIGSVGRVSITVLNDNRCYNPSLLNDWGLSLLLNVDGLNILFDVNSKWSIIQHNAKVVEASLDDVEYIVISHSHRDHVGGLKDAVKYYEGIGVDIVVIGPPNLWLRDSIVTGRNPVKIGGGVATTGALGFSVKEQSLIVNIDGRGLLVIVGCSHPGLRNILGSACRITGVNDVYGVIGGYHVGDCEVYEAIRVFEEYNVKLMGPAHCTSDYAIDVLSRRFKDKVVNIHTGGKIKIP